MDIHIQLHWPQLLYLLILALGTLHDVLNHGKPRANTNAYASILGAIVALGLLYFGGFFSVCN